MCIMGCGKKKFRSTPLVNKPVCFTSTYLIGVNVMLAALQILLG
jgi:hypothetical protein